MLGLIVHIGPPFLCSLILICVSFWTLSIRILLPSHIFVVKWDHRVHSEWRWQISGVHPIWMEKSALVGEGRGCTPTPFHPFTITYKVAGYAPAERADTLPVFHLYPMCTLWLRQRGANATSRHLGADRYRTGQHLQHSLSTHTQVASCEMYRESAKPNWWPHTAVERNPSPYSLTLPPYSGKIINNSMVEKHIMWT